MTKNHPKTLHREALFGNNYATISNNIVKWPCGKTTTHLKLDTPKHLEGKPSACILALSKDGDIIMNMEYFFGTNAYLLSLPQGKPEHDEKAIDTAKRTLEQESGYKASPNEEDITLVGNFLLNPRISSQTTNFYIAKNCTPDGKQHLAPSEIITSTIIKQDKIHQLIEEGLVRDCATSFLISHYLLNLSKRANA